MPRVHGRGARSPTFKQRRSHSITHGGMKHSGQLAVYVQPLRSNVGRRSLHLFVCAGIGAKAIAIVARVRLARYRCSDGVVRCRGQLHLP